MRALALAATLTLGVGFLAVSPLVPATAVATCAGRPVTIDLTDNDHPDPYRPRSDVVLGTSLDDFISTGDGDDVVCAQDGADTVDGGPGDDLLIGGAGRDRLTHADATGSISVDLRILGPQPTGYGADTLRGWENVDGAADYPNRLIGNGAENVLAGGSADDYIDGRDSHDIIYAAPFFSDAEGGDDEFRGGKGGDSVYAGPGDDLAVGGPGDDLVDGGDGVDVVRGGRGHDVVIPGLGDSAGRELVFGGAGDDVLWDRESDELLAGGEGFDVAYLAIPAPTSVSPGATLDLAITRPQDTGGAGTDQLAHLEGLWGSDGEDVLLGDDGPNAIYGFDGSDVIDGRGGVDVCSNTFEDTVSGCEEYDDLPFRSRGPTSSTGAAATTTSRAATRSTCAKRFSEGPVHQTEGSPRCVDRALAFPGLVVPTAGGHDALDAGAPARCGGERVTIDLNRPGAPDPRRGDADVIRGTDGRDVIDAGGGNDVICGGGGKDELDGSRGADVLYGGSGNDVLEWGLENRGNDRTFGGAGDDNLSGAPGDTLHGGPGADHFYGDQCEYRHACVRGIFRMLGGKGADTMRPTIHRDYVDGGPGRDNVEYVDGIPYPSDTGVTVDLARTDPQDTGASGVDVLRDVEWLLGTTEDDHLYGDDGPNRIRGLYRADVIEGRGGDDVLWGEGGRDTCRGGPGNDRYDGCEIRQRAAS